MARRILRTPSLASPRLIGTGIQALPGSAPAAARAIFRFFAALIFVDPRLGAMLPPNLETAGTELERDGEALAQFAALASGLPCGSGLLHAHGTCVFPNPSARLAPEEIELTKRLEEILGGGMKPALSDKPAAKPWNVKPRADKVLVLTPLKNAADLAQSYCAQLARLSYPPELLSIGLLESDSTDGTYDVFQRELGILGSRWRSTGLWKLDYNYSIPQGFHRWHASIQLKRREILARSRNELLERAIKDEDWILWLDVDVTEYPRDIIEQLLSYGKEILHPHCVLEYGGMTFDRNAWREQGKLCMEDLRGREILSPLDAVGGTMLWIRADLHRKGLIFPPLPYGKGNPRIRASGECYDPENPGELETEGLAIMASDMNVQCWGLPDLEIIHRNK
jgi:hypothetical protein